MTKSVVVVLHSDPELSDYVTINFRGKPGDLNNPGPSIPRVKPWSSSSFWHVSMGVFGPWSVPMKACTLYAAKKGP